jgi:peptide-methionine (S)-S-oxide reductase
MNIIKFGVEKLCHVIFIIFNMQTSNMEKQSETVTLGAGCFWCVEAVFENLKGVNSVTSGYAGGFIKNPCYREVCNGITGHAEVVQVVFDPSIIKFSEILEVFWKTHDPTTMNKQGADVGTQYRSAIFYHTDLQKEIAIKSKMELEASHYYPNPIVTEISPFTNFYKAEEDHQNYFLNNPSQPYCAYVIVPKMEKLEYLFKEKLKP